MVKKKKILLIENKTSDYFSARLKLVRFLITKGYEVVSVVPYKDYIDFDDYGVTIIPYQFERNNLGIWSACKCNPAACA